MTAIRIPVAHPLLPVAEAIAPYLQRIDQNRFYSNFGPLVTELEARLAERHAPMAVQVASCNNATLGLAAALIAAGAQPGTVCLLPSWSFSASVHAVRLAGLVPYFLDVDERSWAVTPAIIRQALGSLRQQVGAIMPVCPFGAPVDVALWDDLAQDCGLPVVIDAAASFDAVKPGRSAAVVSLHATKVLGAGEGAYMVSQDAALVQRFHSITSFGFSMDRVVQLPGMNAKMSEYAAAVALAALDAWPQTRQSWIERRQAWLKALGPLADEVFPFEGPAGPALVTSTLNIRWPGSVTALSAALRAQGIDTRRWWSRGCHNEPALVGIARAPLPVTDRLADHVVGLPFFLDIADAAIADCAAVLHREFQALHATVAAHDAQ